MKEKKMLQLSMAEMHSDLSLCLILLNDKSVKGKKGVGQAVMHTVRDRIGMVLEGLKNPLAY